jgi:hypothetical protein
VPLDPAVATGNRRGCVTARCCSDVSLRAVIVVAARLETSSLVAHVRVRARTCSKPSSEWRATPLSSRLSGQKVAGNQADPARIQEDARSLATVTPRQDTAACRDLKRSRRARFRDRQLVRSAGSAAPLVLGAGVHSTRPPRSTSCHSGLPRLSDDQVRAAHRVQLCRAARTRRCCRRASHCGDASTTRHSVRRSKSGSWPCSSATASWIRTGTLSRSRMRPAEAGRDSTTGPVDGER